MAIRLFCVLAVGALPLLALADPAPAQQADWEQRMARGAALKQESETRQRAADRLLQEQNQACYRKFLVNACQADAKKEHVRSTREARRLENESKALERDVRKEQLAEKDRQQALDQAQRQSGLAARQEQSDLSRAGAQRKSIRLREDKAQKAELGEQRKAEQEEKSRRKRAAHEARVAAKMKAAAKREPTVAP